MSEVIGIHECKHEADIGMFHHVITEVEHKLDKMIDILEKLAKLEEKSNQLTSIVDKHATMIQRMNEFIDKQSGSNKWIEKITWYLLSTCAGGGATFAIIQLMK